MGETGQRRVSESDRPLTIRAMVIGGVLVGIVAAAAVAALLYFFGGGTDRDQAALDAVRTAATLVVGTGGAVALLLAARRQRSTELSLEHQREVAAAAARDAVEQRITELYTHAVDQLGNDQAPVRLGGLHALERLAQNNPTQRQTIVDVICAYLRMPFAPPDEFPSKDAPPEVNNRYERYRQELQVRLSAQRILAAHLISKAGDVFWPDIDLDLTEAQLHRIDLTNCRIRNARFDRAQFSGDARFGRVHFSGDAGFSGAIFFGIAWFKEAQFSGDVRFEQAQCCAGALFDRALLAGDARFDGAQFPRGAVFEDATFSGDAWFGEQPFHTLCGGARFSAVTSFSMASFFGHAWFIGAQFCGDTKFIETRFFGYARFDRAYFSGYKNFSSARVRPVDGRMVLTGGLLQTWELGMNVWPANWTTREAGEGDEKGWLHLVCVKE
jgi:uncharacterized protein YjbI with pentapeptide repeats